MSAVLALVLSNLEMVAVFMIPFLLMRFADICFGTILSFKDITLKLEWKKVVSGIVWGLIVAIGIAALVCGAVTLPAFLELYAITIVDTEVLASMVNVLSIIGIIVTSIVTYGKYAYVKMMKIFHISEANELVKLSRIDENGDEDVRYS